MMLSTLTHSFARSSSAEIAILVILVVLLNLRALSGTSKSNFNIQLQKYLLIGIIPTLLISLVIMANHLFAVITTN